MDKKKLSPKQIFRTLAFHYHLDDAISLEVLADMVSVMYYPLQPKGEPRLRYKKLLLDFMKEYNNQQKTMNQQKFIKFMQEMAKNSNEQYLIKLTDRIFNRYRSKQDPNVIEQQGFVRMTAAFMIPEAQARDYFLSVADLKNQITRQKFQDYMNSMLSKK